MIGDIIKKFKVILYSLNLFSNLKPPNFIFYYVNNKTLDNSGSLDILLLWVTQYSIRCFIKSVAT